MNTGQSCWHKGWSTTSGRFAENFRHALVLLAAMLAIVVFNSPNATAQRGSKTGGDKSEPSWEDKWKPSGKKSSAKTNGANVCNADDEMAYTWLNDTQHPQDKGATARLRKETEDLLKKFDSLSLDRFLLAAPENADEAEKKAVEDAKIAERKRVKGEFQGYARKLLDLAISVGISNNQHCQDCILLNDWGYLGYISATRGVDWDIRLQKMALLKHPRSDKEVRLKDVMADAVRDVRIDILTFQAISDTYRQAIDNDKKPVHEALGRVCPNRTIDELEDAEYSRCMAILKTLCFGNELLTAGQHCIKDMLSTELNVILGRIVDRLLSKAAATKPDPRPMTSLNSAGCRPPEGGYFRWLSFLPIASMAPVTSTRAPGTR